MFKKVILSSVVALVLIVGTSQTVQALTADDIQAQIRQLVAKVAELTAQLNALRGAGTTVKNPSQVAPGFPGITRRVCAISLRPFSAGEQNDEVHAFQEFLQTEGFLGVQPTGYFGDLTRQALARWQASQGFEAAGVVGPKTMERIRVWCGGHGGLGTDLFKASPTRGASPLEVVFKSMVGGFRPASTYWVIDFGDGTSERAAECAAPADACTEPGANTHLYTANGTYTATLSKISDPCPDDGDPSTPRCLAAIQSEVVGKVQIAVGTSPVACTKEYVPVCGAKPIVCTTTPCNPIPTTYSNKCMMTADGASFLYQGSCRTGANPADDAQCKTWYDGCNTCSRSTPGGAAACTLKACIGAGNTQPAQCTSRFDTSTNKPPTVKGLSGPTTLALNTSGTWTIAASDPENGQLTYQIHWGDEGRLDQLMSYAGYAPTFVQTTTFTHAYSAAGTYTVVVIVRDDAGQETKATATVKVGDAPVACTMEYNPVCGRPQGCANTCASGMVCPAVCQLHVPQTYGNKCALNGAGAQLIHTGECTSTSGSIY